MNERLKTHSKTQKKSADLVSNKLRIGVFQRYQMKCKSVSKKSPRYTLKKCDSWIEDVYIFQVFKDAWKFHNNNSLRGFRDKQAELKLYTRHYSVENCAEESCRDCNSCIRPSFSLSRSALIRLNAANARFVYQPFTRDQRARG
ncbi:hypothetical protein I3O05_000488 [Escherichia coli]|nr:hypothetical protein [Escherichia coli]